LNQTAIADIFNTIRGMERDYSLGAYYILIERFERRRRG